MNFTNGVIVQFIRKWVDIIASCISSYHKHLMRNKLTSQTIISCNTPVLLV